MTNLNILIADDDETFQLLIRRAVSSLPGLVDLCSLYFVNDGGAAIDFVLGRNNFADRTRYPAPHLVLLDQRMGKVDGSEALHEIKKEPTGRRIPVCILSTSTQNKLYDSCYEMGATFCIAKPMEFERLQQKLKLIVSFFAEVLELPAQP